MTEQDSIRNQNDIDAQLEACTFSDADYDINARVCKILVIGVGGAGNNAVNRMISAGITSADFVAVNTDKQDLYASKAPRRIVLGPNYTKGLGAGSNAAVGKKAAEESKEVIRALLEGTDMLFIAAGMGGGTGTGAAPVIASVAKDMGILTVAVVTTPFKFEGDRRRNQAENGISDLRQFVDTLLVVPNEKLLSVLPKGTTFANAFSYADDVLRQAIQGIADLIVKPSMLNLDFADVRTIMQEKGFAHIGIGEGVGESRLMDAVIEAVNNKLLDTNISEATGAILNIRGGESMTLEEVQNAGNDVRASLAGEVNVIFGADVDPSLGDKVEVTIIATGFKHSAQPYNTTAQPLTSRPRQMYIQPDLTKDNSIRSSERMSERPSYNNSFADKQDRENGGGTRIKISDNDLPLFMLKTKR